MPGSLPPGQLLLRDYSVEEVIAAECIRKEYGKHQAVFSFPFLQHLRLRDKISRSLISIVVYAAVDHGKFMSVSSHRHHVVLHCKQHVRCSSELAFRKLLFHHTDQVSVGFPVRPSPCSEL